MPRPKKEIPLDDMNIRIKGLKTLVKEGKTQDEITEYYSKKLNLKIDRATISRRIKEMKGEKLCREPPKQLATHWRFLYS
jgi:arginine repressor